MKTILVWYLVAFGSGWSHSYPATGVTYSPPMPDVAACTALQNSIREINTKVTMRCVQLPVVILEK